MHVTIADVLLHRDTLTPREAATLTLAIGRAWDRQKALRGDVRLPDASGIALHDSGEITFLLTPTPRPGAGDSWSLTTLLAQLLGVDEADAPPHRVPGGLLMTIAGQLGPLELPTRNEEGFRTALRRFADDRPDVLGNVFWRVAGARPVSARRGARLPIAERRRQTRVVAELRRELRDMERRAFEARLAKAEALARRGASRERRQMVAALVVACVVLVGLVAALGTRSTESTAPVLSAVPQPQEPTLIPAAHVINTPAASEPASTPLVSGPLVSDEIETAPAVRSNSGVTSPPAVRTSSDAASPEGYRDGRPARESSGTTRLTTRVADTAATRSAARSTRRNTVTPRAAKEPDTEKPRPVSFPGGARGIAWAESLR